MDDTSIDIYNNYLKSVSNQEYTISEFKRELSDLEERLLTNKSHRRNEEERLSKDLINLRKVMLEEKISEATKELNDGLNTVRANLMKTENQLNNKLSAISPETITGEFTEKYLGIDRLEKILAKLKKVFKNMFGEEAYTILADRVYKEKIEDNDIKDIINFIREFNILYRETEYNKSPAIIELDDLFYKNIVKLDNENIIKIYLVLAIFSIFLLKYAILFSIIFIALINIISYYKAFTQFSKFMIMYINFDTIKSELVKNSEELYNLEKEKILDSYNYTLSSIKNEINQLEEEISIIASNQIISTNELEEINKKELQLLDEKIEKLNDIIDKCKKKLSKAETVLEGLLAKEKEEKQKLIDGVYSYKVGTSNYPLDEYFLGFHGREIRKYTFNRKSTIIYYYDLDKVITLFKCIISQNLFHTRAGQVFFNIVDSTYMCTSFEIFNKRGFDIFRLCTLSKHLNDFTSKCIEELIDTQYAIRETADIYLHNKFMEEIGGVTQHFIFNLFLTYTDDLLNKEEITKMMTVGSRAGVYSIFAINISKEIKNKDYEKYIEDMIDIDDIIL